MEHKNVNPNESMLSPTNSEPKKIVTHNYDLTKRINYIKDPKLLKIYRPHIHQDEDNRNKIS